MAENIRILHISTYDQGGGAARAAYRLHKGIQSSELSSRMLVQKKKTNDPSVISVANKLENILTEVRPRLDRLPVKLYPNGSRITFSPAILPDNLTKKVLDFNPDIIHLHYIADAFVRLETLNSFRKPIVWTLHDSWAFTGGCHVPFDCQKYRTFCGSCPLLGSNKDYDLSRWILLRKKKAWKDLDLVVVAPSRWLANAARSSSLFCDSRVEVIPNGLDLEQFRPIKKELARNLLCLPLNKKLILFGAMDSTSNPNKGFHLLTLALQNLASSCWAEKAELIIFGASKPDNPPNLGLSVHYVGQLHDDISLALLYAAADVMVVPSIQESFCQTASESMACGTPVVAFGATGLLDVVEHQITGYLAEAFQVADLAQGVTWVLEDDARYQKLSLRSRQRVEDNFSIFNISQQYISVYKQLLS